jgi:hypothetical protein
MIQRIQSVYWIVILIISMLAYSFSNVIIENKEFVEKDYRSMFYKDSFLVISFFSLFSLLCFKKRKIQILINYLLLMLNFLLLISVFDYMVNTDFLKTNIYMVLFINLINIILVFLSVRAVKKDDKLVNSFNRLR